MASAWVCCRECRKMVTFGQERWRKNKPFCPSCYERIRNGTPVKETPETSGKNPEKKKKKQVSMEVDPEELGL